MNSGTCRAAFVVFTVAFVILAGLLKCSGHSLTNSLSASNELRLTFAPHDLQFQVGETEQFTIYLSSPPNETFAVGLVEDKGDIVRLNASYVTFDTNSDDTRSVSATGLHPGALVVWASNDSINGHFNYTYDGSQAFVRIKIKIHRYLDILSDVVGWIYFTAWTISFYPQIYLNFKRRSVVGFHLDFLAMNIVGFTCYSLFNCGLHFDKDIQAEYFVKHPRGVNPVQLNDVVFSLHAVFACSIILAQVFVFERGGQKVSRACIGLLSVAFVFVGVSLVLTLEHVITWLTYLYYFSYVKLVITFVKYIPQAYYNFRRKSTEGWSIGNILLDCTGGTLSIVQMFIISYNYDDWGSVFGDPTKFGLGMFSVLFDVLFMVQHYVLYGPTPDPPKVSPPAYSIVTPVASGDDYIVDPNVHRSYQVQRDSLSPDKIDNVGVR